MRSERLPTKDSLQWPVKGFDHEYRNAQETASDGPAKQALQAWVWMLALVFSYLLMVGHLMCVTCG